MSPFSTRYFLKQNMKRVSKIVFMISMLSLIYVGGLYLTNISEESFAIEYELRDFVRIWQTFDDTDGEQLKALQKQFESADDIEIYNMRSNSYRYKTMLGFRNGARAYVFSKEDFTRFNAKMQLIPSDAKLEDNTILLSQKQAKYLKVKEGDLLRHDSDDIAAYHGNNPFSVVTFPREAFIAYFVTDESSGIEDYLITWKDGSSKTEFMTKVEEFRSQYNKVGFRTYEDAIEEQKGYFEINNIIYYSIIAIVSIVFAITTNSVFVGLYDKRKQEFAFYQGIGIPKKSIYKKVTTEILCMNGMGLIIGVGFSILAVSLLNENIYFKDGLSMRYYHPTAFLAAIFCDIAILIPSIGLRIRNISKDIRDVYFL